MIGSFSLMLHAHIPYCRKSGVWPAGEEWLFEAMNETYIPLLSVFRKFQQRNLKLGIQFGVVPILAEQLADKYMNDRFCEYMEDKIQRAQKDIDRFSNNDKKKRVAIFWKDRFERVFNAYKNDFYYNILGTLKWLQDESIIEITTSAASHAFLPLLESDSGIYSQVQLGISTYEKYFGKKPKGFWLPECAYRYKEYSNIYNKERKAIDEWLDDAGIEYFFIENIGIENAEFIENKFNEDRPTTYRGYRLETGVCVFGRNQETGKQVWSPEYGYPGNEWYREFHGKDSVSGLHYNRVTGKSDKEIYEPEQATQIVKEQANHFISLLQDNLQKNANRIQNPSPIIVSPYDCELFGHWWLEGVDWIENISDLLSNQEKIKYIQLTEFVENNKNDFSTIRMKSSTWGENGDFTVWNNEEHRWIWPYINSCTKDFEDTLVLIKNTNRNLNDRDIRILRQISRELILLEGSDWPFLLYTKQAKEYSNKRFHNHHQRFQRLIWAAKNLDEKNRIPDDLIRKFEDIDNPWKKIDFNLFRRID